jgi:cell wall-associated NlpC family hydrolase
MSTVEPHPAPPTPDVATGRVLHLANPHMTGPDVTAAQQLLTSSPYGDFNVGGIDGEYGELTAAATSRAKWALGYPDTKVDGAFGPKLEAYLGGAPLPADYAARRAQRLAHPYAQQRAQIVANAEWGVAHESQIHYSENGPRLAGLGHPQLLPLVTDCSGFATLCFNWAAAPDPNGNAYDPHKTAYTGTMMMACHPVPRSAVQPGDLVVFGAYPGNHVCVVVRTGADPLLVSHGSEGGPKHVPFSAELAWQAAHGGPQPSPGLVMWLSAFPDVPGPVH